jgi:hypothetical protein
VPSAERRTRLGTWMGGVAAFKDVVEKEEKT